MHPWWHGLRDSTHSPAAHLVVPRRVRFKCRVCSETLTRRSNCLVGFLVDVSEIVPLSHIVQGVYIVVDKGRRHWHGGEEERKQFGLLLEHVFLICLWPPSHAAQPTAVATLDHESSPLCLVCVHLANSFAPARTSLGDAALE